MSSYIDHCYCLRDDARGERARRVKHSWADHTAAAIRWQKTPERAAAILQGKDAAAQADLAAWRALGTRKARASA